MSEKQQEPVQQLEIRHIYTKDVSLETPLVSELLRNNWRPEILIDIDLRSKKLEEENLYEDNLHNFSDFGSNRYWL